MKNWSIPGLISWVLHPVFIPALFMLLLLSGDYYLNGLLRPGAMKTIMLTVLIFTLALPLLIFTLARYLRIITSFEMHLRSERMFGATILAVAAFFCRQLLLGFELPEYYTSFLLITVAGALLALLLMLFIRISLHMFGWSMLVFSLVAYSLAFGSPSLWMIPVAVAFCGVIAYARLASQAHVIREVYLGFFLGIIPVGIVFVLF